MGPTFRPPGFVVAGQRSYEFSFDPREPFRCGRRGWPCFAPGFLRRGPAKGSAFASGCGRRRTDFPARLCARFCWAGMGAFGRPRRRASFAMTGTEFTSFGLGVGSRDRRYIALCETADGSIWTSTANGLARLKNGQTALFTTNNGLPSDHVLTGVPGSSGGDLGGMRERLVAV